MSDNSLNPLQNRHSNVIEECLITPNILYPLQIDTTYNCWANEPPGDLASILYMCGGMQCVQKNELRIYYVYSAYTCVSVYFSTLLWLQVWSKTSNEGRKARKGVSELRRRLVMWSSHLRRVLGIFRLQSGHVTLIKTGWLGTIIVGFGLHCHKKNGVQCTWIKFNTYIKPFRVYCSWTGLYMSPFYFV